ncbi:hypothetical protein [Roseibium polysiphoniae]|nr:hypothetical protein [Roseibium polysiphoniae]
MRHLPIRLQSRMLVAVRHIPGLAVALALSLASGYAFAFPAMVGAG